MKMQKLNLVSIADLLKAEKQRISEISEESKKLGI